MQLIPTSNVDLHNRPPPNKTQKNHLPPPSPRVMSSSPLAAFSPHVAPALFVCGCCVVSLPLVVISHLVTSPRHVAALRCVSHCPSRLIVVESSRRRVVASSRCHVLSCLVVVLRPLTHLVTPALFDCYIVALHLVLMACLSQCVNLPSRRTMLTLMPSLLIFRPSTATKFSGRPTHLPKRHRAANMLGNCHADTTSTRHLRSRQGSMSPTCRRQHTDMSCGMSACLLFGGKKSLTRRRHFQPR